MSARKLSLAVVVFCLVLISSFFTGSALGQDIKRPDGSVPLPMDWSSRSLIYTVGFTPKQASKMKSDPRFLLQMRSHGKALADAMAATGNSTIVNPVKVSGNAGTRSSQPQVKKDWSVSLGAGGVAQGMYPAKYSFNVNATPSCTADYAVFPINASTGYTRAHVVGTFSTTAVSGTGSVEFTVAPTGGTAVNLTLAASTATNTGTSFEVSTTAGTSGADSNATNLAAAINRNLSSTALGRIVAIASTNTVTVYTLTPGTRAVLTVPATVTNLTWGGVTVGGNGAQANIVGFNHLYSGSGTPLCTGLTYPEFIFSYASGVGPVATSPALSADGTKIAYVENDPNIGAIFHVLTFAPGTSQGTETTTTEYGTCTNSGKALPTCATVPVIPGSTAGSTATDFMLPLGLVTANAATGVAGAADSFSSPFVAYDLDITYVGDNNGYLYSISPTFNTTPAHAGGNFPVHVSASPTPVAPTGVTATAGTPGVVTVTVANTLGIGELVTIAGVASNTHCNANDIPDINGTQTVTSATAASFTFNATISNATTATCTVTNATITPGSNYLSSPTIDFNNTRNIFIGDSSANLYEVTPGGTVTATLSAGENLNGGIRDAPIVDTTNAVGYVVVACNANAIGEADLANAALVQFQFTTNSMTLGNVAALDTAANQNCTVAGYPIYDPVPDERYYDLGISSATETSNGEMITASSGSGGQQVKAFGFLSSALQTMPIGNKPQWGTNASPISPLTEFYNSQAFTPTAVTATTTTVTVTAANTLAVNDMVTISGITANTTNGCTTADVGVITGVDQTVASVNGTEFTFNATIPSATSGTGCTVPTGATGIGGPDYTFMGVVQNPPAVYTLLVPFDAESYNGAGTEVDLATNTTDAPGGTSGIIVDNDSTDGQASSIYFGTLAKSTTLCGTTASYCAIKLTQSLLE